MAYDNDFNKKSLHEAILYYFKENTFVNNIIITNAQILYLFRAREFKQKILENKSIKNILKSYEDKSIDTIQKTSDVYDKLKEILSSEDIEIEVIKLDLFDDDINIEHLYKIFDKHFLFNKKQENDANIICDEFFRELIYIMGLVEDIKDNHKLVKSDVKNSLLDITMDMVDTSEDKFEEALNLNILWINRILFLKILEAELRVFRNEKEFAILSSKDIKGYSQLSTLFFNVLAKVRADRKNESYDDIPYLNSSLFEEAEKEKHHSIAKLENDLPIEIMKGSVLYYDKSFKEKELSLLQYLLLFLECYKFNSDEDNTDNHTVIKSSVLGLVFERLNGYKEGSHFTPSVITMYMSKVSIERIVLDKFNEAFSETSFENYQEIKQYASANSHKQSYKDCGNEAINSIKIIDPACGSGHFLVSCLNELVRIRSDLLLLDNRIEIIIKNDEFIVFYRHTDDEFVYQKNECGGKIDSASSAIQKSIFEAKKYIIENQIYGVDININSVNICRLRLWIELLKHSYYTDTDDLYKGYKDLEILPNLEFKVVASDSLVNVKYDTMFFGKNDMEELRKNMRDYFNSSSQNKKDIKNKVRKIIDELKEHVPEFEDYEPFDVLAKNSFFDSAVMFGIDKFDLVIGNPPYIEARSSNFTNEMKSKYQKQKNSDWLSVHSNVAEQLTSGIDLSIYFYLKGLKLLNKNGILAYVCTNSWLTTQYGINFQNFLIKNNIHTHLIDSNTKYFSSANINTIISIINFSDKPSVHFQYYNEHYNPLSIVKDFFIDDIQLLIKYKWSLLQYFSQELLSVLGKIDKGKTLQSVGLDSGQGLNGIEPTTKKSGYYFCNKRVIAQYSFTDTDYYIDKKQISSRNPPIFIMPRGVGATHFCMYNRINAYSNSYVEIYRKLFKENNIEKDVTLLSIWFFYNSTLGWLLRELYGRKNLGGGMLKAEAIDIKNIPCIFDIDVNKASSIFEKSKYKKIENYTIEIETDIHKEIDTLLYHTMSINKEEAKYIKELFLSLIKDRYQKSKNKKSNSGTNISKEKNEVRIVEGGNL